MATVLCAWPASAQLRVVQTLVAQFDGGPAVAPGFAFVGGESIFLAFDIDGFKPSADEDPKLDLSWTCQPFDAAGVALLPAQSGVIKVVMAPEDKKWKPRVRLELALPPDLPALAGEVRITVRDLQGGTQGALAVPIEVRGAKLDQITKLQPIRFRFLRSEDSLEALAVPAYKQADTVWARFDMAGYKLGPANEFQVSYGLEALRANGESLYRQDGAAAENGKTFYPRRVLSGALSLQLTKDLAPGEYTILLRLRDGIGGEQSETRHSFRVE